MLRKTKIQILEDCDKYQVIPSYVKLPYPHLIKRKRNRARKFRKFIEMFIKSKVDMSRNK